METRGGMVGVGVGPGTTVGAAGVGMDVGVGLETMSVGKAMASASFLEGMPTIMSAEDIPSGFSTTQSVIGRFLPAI